MTTAMKILVPLVLSACGITPEHTDTGPLIDVTLDESDQSSQIRSEDGNGSTLAALADGSYDILVTMLPMDGISKTKSDFKNSTIASISVNFAVVGGAALPGSPLVPDSLDVVYTRRDHLMFAASDLGKMIQVTAAAVDSNDVHSNNVDFTFALGPHP